VSSAPRQGTLPVGPLVAAVGAVMLIVSLGLDWYEGITGFTVFEFIDLLLVLLALATIASLAGGMGFVRPPAASPAVSLAVAIFTVFVVASQIINHPPAAAGDGGPAKDIGIWLALAGGALMVVGAVLGYAQISLAVEARQRPRRDTTDHEAPTVATPAPESTPKPEPGPGRPVASSEEGDEPERGPERS
jgi:amino acid transporter